MFESATTGPLRCQVCGVLIGAYEPVTVRADGTVRRTSVASEPELSPLIGEHYHGACYDTQLEDYSVVGVPGQGRLLRLV